MRLIKNIYGLFLLLAIGFQPLFAAAQSGDGAVVKIELKGAPIEMNLFQVGTTLFSDRGYTLVECPDSLAGDYFFRTSIKGVRFQCLETGTVCVLTPAPQDSKDSAATALLDQGFVKRSIPSFQLMLTGAAQRVDVYQKTLQKEEWVTVPKWGVVVGFKDLVCTEDFSYNNPPQVVVNPPEKYAASTRKFQGIPSLAIAPQGRLWATWYGGPVKGENEHNYVIVVTSSDGGATWSDEIVVIDPDGPGPVRTFDAQVWIDPNGKMWLFWAQTIGHDAKISGVWAMTTEQPDQENPVWSEPMRIADGIMMGKPDCLSTGEWMLPTSVWHTDDSARMVVSLDEGKTWAVRGAANIPAPNRSCDEQLIVERKDGSLWMWIRTKFGIGESFSLDRGEHWTPVCPSEIQHPAARFFVRRLASGNLLLVKHGGIYEKLGRSHLSAFISKDEGVTWEGGLLLDERSSVSYPDGMQGEDGTIYIAYDRSRGDEKEILMARFSEEDVLAKQPVSPAAKLRVLINKATGK